MAGFEPESIFEIITESGRKSFIHPVRQRILNYLVKEALTISQVAERLEVHAANLSHHFRNLKKNGLVVLVEERKVGNYTEKYYRSVARLFDVVPDKKEAIHRNGAVLGFLRNDISKAISQLKGDDSEKLIGLTLSKKINRQTFQRFASELDQLIRKYSTEDDPDGEQYSLNLSLYPHESDYGPLRKIKIEK